MTVCATCGQIFGPFVDVRYDGVERHQRCRCGPARDRSREPRWPGRDVNHTVELCHCCGAALITSGWRFDPFFCDACGADVEHINHTGNLIPLSRHTLDDGFGLGSPGASPESEAARFEVQFEAFFARVRHLDAWRMAQVKSVLASSSDAPVPDYLAKAASSADRTEAFLGLVRHFAMRR